MAKASEWQRYQLLKDLIAEAINDAGVEEDEEVTLAISPDFSEVYANPGPYPPFEDGDEDFDDWFIEHAANAEEAIGVADLYFDLR